MFIIRTKIASPRSATHTIDTVPNAVLAAEEIELARKGRHEEWERFHRVADSRPISDLTRAKRHPK